jgi:hypothetical protein
MQRKSLFAFVTLCVAIFLAVGPAVAQVNTATLSGQVTDPHGLAVRDAKITVTNAATGAERSAMVDEEGRYILVGLAPGEYKVRAEGGTNFAHYEDPSLKLTVGEKATLDIMLRLGTQTQSVTVTTESAPVEVTRSESAQTVEQRQINNLPINGRSYINFTLLNSQTTRDNAPTIGPAPNSGLNISGARARSNMVSVDGADFGDNSVDGIRTTLSQEAVQEFQMILSNYNAEYGRATGGVVNIVTKSGTNDFHGNVFGFLRNSAFQARNPFSGEVNSAGQLVPVKQAYTRVQAGVTLGGALKKNKTFYFFSYEYTQREETGFSSIGQGNFGLVPVTLPNGLPVELTQAQANFVKAVTPISPSLATNYGVVMGSASGVAVNKLDYGALVSTLSGGTITPVNPVVTPAGPLFQEFPFPVSCPAGMTINAVNCSGFAALGSNGTPVSAGAAPLPTSYVGLNSIRGNFPTQEKTSLWSARLDQQWNPSNHSFLRVGVSPSYVTGLQTTAQNQVLGQNAASRVGVNWLHDLSATFQHDTIVSNATYNEFRFQFARRSNYFGFSNLPGGSELGVNIPGYAYFGREPYSTVSRVEKRYEFTDNVTWTHGHHTFKFGGDVNILQLRPSNSPQIFTLDFGGVANFSGLPASSFGLPDCLTPGVGPHNGACASGDIVIPGATALQVYGFGIPAGSYIQGIGNSNNPFDNLPFGFFAQDTWKATRKLTINYGLRYDVEITPLFAPATAINAAAEKALGVIEGIPRDYHNVAPRIGLAWDPKGDGRMVVRAGYGLFYDHPLLAVAFDSATADGGRSVQLLSPPGVASACGVLTPGLAPPGYPLCNNGLDTPNNLNGASIFQGVLSALPSMYYLANQQRFDPLQPNSLFANQNYLTAGFPLTILPFTLPVAKNFQYGYAQQVNLTVEKQFATNWTLSVGYQGSRGLHLYRPIDVNYTDPALLATNFQYAEAAGLAPASPFLFAVPSSDVAPTSTTCGLTVNPALKLVPGVLGALFGCPSALSSLDGKFVGTPPVFNYFRLSGPNPSYATAIGQGAIALGLCPPTAHPFTCGYGVQQQLAAAAKYPVGFGTPVPFNSVDAQESNAASWYNALTVNLQKRFSHNFELLSSYTWSHSIDNGTDLQSTLEPQDSRFPQLERGNSVNDQRHRWVTSGVWQTSPGKAGDSFWKHLASNWTLAPIIEVSSGRPFNVITGRDSRLDLGASQARPSVTGATTSPYISGFTFSVATLCLQNNGQPFSIPNISPPEGCDGTLGRDRFTMPFFFQFDLRVAKRIPLGERFSMDLMADGFNLTNHTNISAVNQLCDPSSGNTCFAGQPTAAYDARIFQFALKLSW